MLQELISGELPSMLQSARYSKNTVGRTYSMEDKASQLHKPIHVYDFSDNSDISSVGRMNENEKDEDSYESFEPPLHSTAIYTDEVELSRHCGSFLPSTPPGKDAKRSSDTSEIEEDDNESIKISAKKKTQKKERMFCGKRKKSRNEARDTDISDCEHIWCLKGKKSSDIMDLDVVLSAFEKAFPEYKQNVESKICKEAINKFHSSMKEELIKMLAEVQMLTALRRKNAKMISDIEKKRQRLIEVQDELLWSEPQLKQLQIKYDELKEKKSSLRNAAYFLSNLKQLHQDYSDIQEREPNVKETYDSSSLPALLFKARTLLGAESHLQNINHQLEKLLDQK
ncbi:centromere protein U isoform X4 [Molossus molossus]|uniref:centromere protein U isoform X4 n=1 Tax=Molossus molossus TaxID=27622 RepID=UPI001745F4A5|nr:centromere protein U isoform X4 [Molossus molossus]